MSRYRLECGEIIEGEIINVSCIAPDSKYFRNSRVSRDILDKITRYVALYIGVKYWIRIGYRTNDNILHTTYSWCSTYYCSYEFTKFKKKYEI